MEVGPTNPAGMNLDQNLMGSRGKIGKIDKSERAPDRPQLHGKHADLLDTWRSGSGCAPPSILPIE
jgi:hypothetical protein